MARALILQSDLGNVDELGVFAAILGCTGMLLPVYGVQEE